MFPIPEIKEVEEPSFYPDIASYVSHATTFLYEALGKGEFQDNHNIYYIIPHTRAFKRVKNMLRQMDAQMIITNKAQPFVATFYHLLYNEEMLEYLRSPMKPHFVNDVIKSCFKDVRLLEISEVVIYFATPDLPLLDVIVELLSSLRQNQVCVIAFVHQGPRGCNEDNDCRFDLIWSLFGKLGNELREITDNLLITFIRHNEEQAWFDLKSLIMWAVAKADKNQRETRSCERSLTEFVIKRLNEMKLSPITTEDSQSVVDNDN